MGNGLFLLDRRWDTTRAAIATALGVDSAQPPPLKKLCVVDSRLPSATPCPTYVVSNEGHQPPQPQRPADPYTFIMVEAPAAVTTSQAPASSHASTAPVRSSVHPPGSSSSGSQHAVVAATTPVAIQPAPAKGAPHPSKLAAPSPRSGGTTSNGGSVLLSSGARKKRPSSSSASTVGGVTVTSMSSSSLASTLAPSGGAAMVSGVTFPFRTQLGGALSRLQVSSGGAPGAVLAQRDGGAVLVTTADVLNGQVGGGGLLHSVTVSKPAAAATALLQCRTVAEERPGPVSKAPTTLLKARKPQPTISSSSSSPAAGRAALAKNHHYQQQQPAIAQGLALPELLSAPQVPLPPSGHQPLANGLPTVLGQSKLFPVSNHALLDGTTAYHHPAAQLVAKGARNGSRSHPGRAVLPDTTSAVVAAAGGVAAAASLPASVAKQQLYQQVLAGQVQAQLVPGALKLPLLLPNDERRHRPQQAQLKVPGGSLPT